MTKIKMNKQQLLAETHRLKLPKNEYLIVGGGSLTVRDIRETSDIDIVVTTQLFEILKQRDWSFKIRPNGKPKLYNDFIEIYLDVNTENFKRSTSWLIQHADIFDQVRFIDLKSLIGFKQSYGREKDIRDIQLIKTYLTMQK